MSFEDFHCPDDASELFTTVATDDPVGLFTTVSINVFRPVYEILSARAQKQGIGVDQLIMRALELDNELYGGDEDNPREIILRQPDSHIEIVITPNYP